MNVWQRQMVFIRRCAWRKWRYRFYTVCSTHTGVTYNVNGTRPRLVNCHQFGSVFILRSTVCRMRRKEKKWTWAKFGVGISFETVKNVSKCGTTEVWLLRTLRLINEQIWRGNRINIYKNSKIAKALKSCFGDNLMFDLWFSPVYRYLCVCGPRWLAH